MQHLIKSIRTDVDKLVVLTKAAPSTQYKVYLAALELQYALSRIEILKEQTEKENK